MKVGALRRPRRHDARLREGRRRRRAQLRGAAGRHAAPRQALGGGPGGECGQEMQQAAADHDLAGGRPGDAGPPRGRGAAPAPRAAHPHLLPQLPPRPPAPGPGGHGGHCGHRRGGARGLLQQAAPRGGGGGRGAARGRGQGGAAAEVGWPGPGRAGPAAQLRHRRGGRVDGLGLQEVAAEEPRGDAAA